jgi:hypothetical protein
MGCGSQCRVEPCGNVEPAHRTETETQGFTNFSKGGVAGSDLMFNAGVACK